MNPIIQDLNTDNITFFESFYGLTDPSKIVPQMEVIPQQFFQGKTKWQKYVENWDASGLEKDTKIIPKMGINKEIIIKKIEALLNSRHTIDRNTRLSVASFLMHISFENVVLKDPKYIQRFSPA